MFSITSRFLVAVLLTAFCVVSAAQSEFPRGAVLSLTDEERYQQSSVDVLFGYSVAVSGNTALVGAPGFSEGINIPGGDSEGLWDSGRVAVFTRMPEADAGWQRTATLRPSDISGKLSLGLSLAIDRNTAVVGAMGAAYVFQERAKGWREIAKLSVSPDAVRPVAVDRGTILLTAHDGIRAYEVQPNGRLNYLGLVRGEGGAFDIFRDTVVVGVQSTDPSLSGAAYVYRRHGRRWHLQEKLVPSDADPVPRFGEAVGIRGRAIVVGASSDIIGDNKSGAAYVFLNQRGHWVQSQRIEGPPTDEVNDHAATFGAAVAMAPGRVAIAGTSRARQDSGKVMTFVWEGLYLRSEYTFNSNWDFSFGRDIDMWGSFLIAGAPYFYMEPHEGSARLYDLGPLQFSSKDSVDLADDEPLQDPRE